MRRRCFGPGREQFADPGDLTVGSWLRATKSSKSDLLASVASDLQTEIVILNSGSRSRRAEHSMRFRSTRERSIWLLAIALVPAVLWAVAQQLGWPVWVRALLAAVAAVTVVVTPEIRQRRAQTDTTARDLRKFESVTPEGHLKFVRDVGLDTFRVHAASRSIPYVARDAGNEFDEAIRARTPVLIVGHSMSGKSRLAAERIKALFPDAPLLVPTSTLALRAIVDDGAVLRGVVVWLDDLERYLKGEGSLDLSLLNQLINGDAIIVSTIRRNALNAFRPTNEDYPPQWAVVQRFTRVPLARRLTEVEERLARSEISDMGTLDAIERYGLAEYLGGGPPAVDRFDDGEVSNPVGYALVRAAVDWRRAGLVRLISGDNLRMGMLFYLEDRPGVRTDDLAIQEGLDWATERINETVGLLGIHERRAEVSTASAPLSYEAFDYLVDVIVDKNRVSKNAEFPIPVGLWTMVEAAATPAEQSDIGMATTRYFVSRPRVTHAVASWLAGSDGSPHGLLITGRPGSGKSALLFQLRSELPNMLSAIDSAARDSFPPQADRARLVPSDSFFPLFRTNVADIKAALAEKFGLPPLPSEFMLDEARSNHKFVNFFISELEIRRGQTVMLFDGLDEARDPRAMAELLHLLASSLLDLPAWVILSSRPVDGIGEVGPPGWAVIDLDAEAFTATKYDVASSIRQQLLQAPGSPYQSDPQLAQEVADLIARTSEGNSYMGRMLVERALAGLDVRMPNSLIEFVQETLGQFGPDREDAVTILRVLAESDRNLTAEELLQAASGRGALLGGQTQLERIMSGLSSLVFSTGESESQGVAYGLAHEAIREAFGTDF